MSKAIYIEWKETQSEFVKWNYIANGVADPIFKTKVVTKSVRYSSEVTNEMIERANEWIKKERPEGKVVVK